MITHQFFLQWNLGSNTSRLQVQQHFLIVRSTLIILLCSVTSAVMASPLGDAVASRSLGQLETPEDDDSYLRSVRQYDPYDVENRADPIRAAIGRPYIPQTFNGDPNSRLALHLVPTIARTLNYSVEPDEIVQPGYARALGASAVIPVINTLDPLAHAAAIVDARPPSAVATSTTHGTSRFIAGDCLYYVQDLIIQGLPSACR